MKGNLNKKNAKILAALLVFMLIVSLFTGCKRNSVGPNEVQENHIEEQQEEASEVNNPQELTEGEASEEQSGELAETEASEEQSGELAETEASEEQSGELAETGDSDTEAVAEKVPDEAGFYYTKDEVALYIHVYGHLPDNFMTKKEAKKLGWSGGSLEKYAEGMVIGGDRFGNYEGNLPEKDGRTYTECDIDTLGQKKRGAKRIVFSNDGLVYYTEDHYETFELLYGDENL